MRESSPPDEQNPTSYFIRPNRTRPPATTGDGRPDTGHHPVHRPSRAAFRRGLMASRSARPLAINPHLANKPLTPVFSMPMFSPVVNCHPLQIRIHWRAETGKQPGVSLLPTGGVPIDPAVFGYIRVSQAEGENGLATQRRILNDHGLRDDRIFTDVASGRNMRRPSWMELRGILRSGDTVVVPRLDRLARNLWEGLKTIEELHDQGINIRSLAEGLDTGDESPTSRLMLHMLLSLAEWERETHPGPDQGRGGPRRGRRQDRGKAAGAVTGEGGGCQGLPRERRVGQCRGQDLWGEPPHRAGRQGRDLRGRSALT